MIYTYKDWARLQQDTNSTKSCQTRFTNPSTFTDDERRLFDAFPLELHRVAVDASLETTGALSCFFDVNRIPSLYYDIRCTDELDQLCQRRSGYKVEYRCATVEGERYALRRRRPSPECDEARANCLEDDKFLMDKHCCQWAMVAEQAALGYKCVNGTRE